MLAEVRRGEVTLHQALIGIGGRIVHKGVDLFRRWRQTEQVELQSANERGAIRFRRRFESFFPQPIQNEAIDRIAHPGRRDSRHRRPRQRMEGPMVLRLRTAPIDIANSRAPAAIEQVRAFMASLGLGRGYHFLCNRGNRGGSRRALSSYRFAASRIDDKCRDL